jgi:hypothetical protein
MEGAQKDQPSISNINYSLAIESRTLLGFLEDKKSKVSIKNY